MPNVLDVRFRNHTLRAYLDRIELRQSYGNHTLALIDYRIDDRTKYNMPRDNAPMTIRWGETPLNVTTFYGYFNHYETITGDDQVNTRVVALGTSKKMNSALGGNWEGMTRSGIARDIARRHKLRSIIHRHPVVVDNWAAGARSDIQLLRDLAQEVGYRTWIDGATLYFVDPTKLLVSAGTLATPRFDSDSIIDMKILGGLEAPAEGRIPRRRAIYGLDNNTNELFLSVAGSEELPMEMVPTAVNTYGEAEGKNEAAKRQIEEYYTARMTVKGNVGLHPGSLLKLDPDTVARDQAGMWVVNEATHVLTDDRFITRIEASKGRRMALSTPTTIKGARLATAAVVRDGKQWEAAVQEHLNV